jgi:hypothetical protein
MIIIELKRGVLTRGPSSLWRVKTQDSNLVMVEIKLRCSNFVLCWQHKHAFRLTAYLPAVQSAENLSAVKFLVVCSADHKMAEAGGFEVFEALHRDLEALRENRLPTIERLSTELRAHIVDFQNLLDHKKKNNESRKQLASGAFLT